MLASLAPRETAYRGRYVEAPIRAITYNRVDILRSHSFIEDNIDKGEIELEIIRRGRIMRLAVPIYIEEL